MVEPIILPKNAIPISENKWVHFVSDSRGAEVMIDYLLKELEPMWHELESICSAGCCGIDAFDFYPENITKAADNLNVRETCHQIDLLQAQLDKLEFKVFGSDRLELIIEKNEFQALLNHLLVHFSAQLHAST